MIPKMLALTVALLGVPVPLNHAFVATAVVPFHDYPLTIDGVQVSGNRWLLVVDGDQWAYFAFGSARDGFAGPPLPGEEFSLGISAFRMNGATFTADVAMCQAVGCESGTMSGIYA